MDFVEFNNKFKPNWIVLFNRYLDSKDKEYPIFSDDKDYIEFINMKTNIIHKESLYEYINQ
jgi:hypothetical protein